MKNDKQRCGTRRYHQSEMKNPTTLISGTVTPKWTVPGERNLQIIPCHPSNFDEIDRFQRNLFLKPISSICPYQVLFLRLELKLNDYFYD